jgi:methyl-accepting chemotaxis protein
MGIEWYRDLVVCVAGAVTTVVLIVVGVVLLSLRRRIARALDSMEATAEKARSVLSSVEAASDKAGSILGSLEAVSAGVQSFSSYVREEIGPPMVRFAAVARGIRERIDRVSSHFRKKEGGSHG